MFPSSEDVRDRIDKKEVWYVEVEVLTKVAQKWTRSQDFLEGNESIYTDLVLKLKPNGSGQVEVDDFLWVIMMQWAKLAAWNVKRIITKSADAKRDLIANAAMIQSKTRKTITSVPTLHLQDLKSLIESIYPKSDNDTRDSQLFISSYVNKIAVNRSVLLLESEDQVISQSDNNNIIKNSKFSTEFEKILKKNILSDSNSKMLKPYKLSGNENKVEDVFVSKYKSPIFNFPTIKSGASPSLLYNVVRKSFMAYQTVLTQKLTKVDSLVYNVIFY